MNENISLFTKTQNEIFKLRKQYLNAYDTGNVEMQVKIENKYTELCKKLKQNSGGN